MTNLLDFNRHRINLKSARAQGRAGTHSPENATNLAVPKEKHGRGLRLHPRLGNTSKYIYGLGRLIDFLYYLSSFELLDHH